MSSLAVVSRRLERHYVRAERAGRVERGRRWYPTANALLRAAAEDSGYSLEQAAAVFAIVSPGTQLVSNFEWTRAALQSRGQAPVGRFPNVMAPKVRRALADEGYARSVATGPKVAAFLAAILGDTDSLVLDRWALFAAAGEPNENPSPRERETYTAAYRETAARVGETVSAFQAIVWIQVRETTPDKRGRIRRLQDIV
jgi:hypothetical protein